MYLDLRLAFVLRINHSPAHKQIISVILLVFSLSGTPLEKLRNYST